MWSIGDLSRRTGVKVPTIRYYEQMGLLPPAERSEGNQRRYATQDGERLSFIKHARELGFPVEAIRDLMALNEAPQRHCADAHAIATSQWSVVRDKIGRLRVLEKELRRIAEATHDGNRVAECSVIRALTDRRDCRCDDYPHERQDKS